MRPILFPVIGTMVIVSWTSVTFAQNVLSGKITDSLTRDPVPYASIFLASTAIGTTADEKGEFVINNVPPGKYQIVTSSIGYKSITLPVVLNREPLKLDVVLRQDTVQLRNVIIKDEILQNPMDVQQFRRYFLGETRNASSCRIINQKKIALFYKSKNVFVARAKAPIEIENRALGYKLIFDLKSFEVDFNKSTLRYQGMPRFEYLTPKSAEQEREWERQRKRAYTGSFRHLVRSLQSGVIDTSFVICELFRVPNRKRPSDQFLEKKIRYWRGQYYSNKGMVRTDGSTTRADFDSLSRYHYLKQEPKIVDSIGRIYTQAAELLDETGNNLVYTGTGELYIIYKGERKEFGYLGHRKLSGDTARFEQHSIVHFKAKKVPIYENGYYDATDLFFEGYMGWSEKIAELLPLEYEARKEDD